MKNTSRYKALVCPMAALILLAPSLAHAADSSPAEVTAIQETVAEMNRTLARWTMAVADDSCEADRCSKTTVWTDTEKDVRKISTTVTTHPDAAQESDKSLTETYFDADGALIFELSRLNHFKGPTSVAVHEEQGYLDKRKLVAWKTDQDWHDAADAYWTQTQIELLSEGDAALAEAHEDLKAKLKK